MTVDLKWLKETGRDLMTQTRLRAQRKCPRFHQLRFEAGIVASASRKPLRMGSAFHLGQELLAKVPAPLDEVGEELILQQHGRDGIKQYEEDRQQQIDAAILAALVDYNGPCPEFTDPEDWKVEREIVGRMLMGYVWRWQAERLEILHAEVEFRQPVYNVETQSPLYRTFPSKSGPPTRIMLRRAGKIDKICRLPDGRVAILEHKTTGDSIAPNSDYWAQAKISSQVTFYLDAAVQDSNLPSPDVIFYDVIRKPSIEPKLLTIQETRDFLGLSYRKGKKTVVAPNMELANKYYSETFSVEIQGHVDHEDPDKTQIQRVFVDGSEAKLEESRLRETPSMFGARLMQDMVDRPDMYFARVEIPRLKGDVEEFQADTHQTVEAIIHCQRTGHWPRNTDSCTFPFRCEYFNLCSNNIQVTVNGEVPRGFARLDFVHPELNKEL